MEYVLFHCRGLVKESSEEHCKVKSLLSLILLLFIVKVDNRSLLSRLAIEGHNK